MLERLLGAWTLWVTQRAALVMTIALLATAGAGYYAVTAFSMNSDTSRLIRQDTDWKRINNAFIETFPQYDQNTFVVISGPRPNALADFTRGLADQLRTNNDIFSSVFSPTANDYLDRYALLYQNEDDLSDTVGRLAEAQPFLTAIASDESLRSVLNLTIDALETDEALPGGFIQMTEALELAANRAIGEGDEPISWRDELFGVSEGNQYYQVIFVQGQQNFGQDLPNATIIGRLEQVIHGFEHPFREEVRVRLTGQVPLEHGEIVSAMDSARLAGSLALMILILVMVWGVRSLRIIGATYVAMLVGLIWTAAFAMVAVGQYNTISIIFLVMFIGLGVDFAIHLCLKFQEARTTHPGIEALKSTGADLGPAIMLCGITSAIGFLAFVPTDYIGLAEMGIISGGGMIIAVIISLTLIPAFFAIAGDPRPPVDLPMAGLMTNLVADHHRQAAWATLALAIVLATIASRATFDYSTLSLKDPDSEAMTTLDELHDEDIITDYALRYMADSLADAQSTKARLLAHDVVSDVSVPGDYLPEDQLQKRYILEDAMFLLDSVFSANSDTTPFTDDELAEALQHMERAIAEKLTTVSVNDELKDALTNLQSAVGALSATDAETRAKFTELIMPPMKTEIQWLGKALSVNRDITLSDLPVAQQARLVGNDGKAVVSITPAENVVQVEALRRFTEEVMAVVPAVTGRPVLDLGIGDIVVRAFAIAIGLAVAVIFIILLLSLRSLVDAILVFIPLGMTAMLTLTVSVLIDLPLNMANVVVIPLIFGLGVDNGIHIVKRFHQTIDARDFVQCSTPKAVFLSNLTTLGTFGALSFSTHQGIYSIGVLLTVALSGLMVLTLIALPALLETFSTRRPGP